MTQPNHPHTRTPPALWPHRNDFRGEAWREYTLELLGNTVAFFVQRSQQRTNPRKIAKDLYDAKNYLAMMQAHVEQHVLDLGIGLRQLDTLFDPTDHVAREEIEDLL